MPAIDENRILGNYGSNLVAHTLSKICLVRPVAEGTDIGIDLYCETIEEGQGLLHFWVQVKCGKQIKIKKNGRASCKFEVTHLSYWNRQPVPVLAFYVPTEFPPEIPKQIFVANITEHILEHGIPKTKYKTIESHFKISPGSEDWQNGFHQRLKATTSLIKFRDDGIFSSITELKPKYTIQYRKIFGSSKYAKKSLRTIESTVSSLVLDAALLKYHKSIDPPEKFFKRLVSILNIFEEGKRPETMKALGLWAAIIERDTVRANEMINIGIESIDNDPNLDDSFRKTWRKEFILDPDLEIIKTIEATK